MSTRIRMTWSTGAVSATLLDTPTTHALLEALPLTGSANLWGEELYFAVPVQAELEPSAQQVVEPGTVCFWVEGGSLALPWGATPIAHQGESRLVSRCNVLGRIDGDPATLAGVRAGEAIRVEREA